MNPKSSQVMSDMFCKLHKQNLKTAQNAASWGIGGGVVWWGRDGVCRGGVGVWCGGGGGGG